MKGAASALYKLAELWDWCACAKRFCRYINSRRGCYTFLWKASGVNVWRSEDLCCMWCTENQTERKPFISFILKKCQMLNITAAGTCRSKWGYNSHYKHWCMHVLRLVDQWNKMFLWTCYRVDKLKIILFHDFNAVASSNMNQPTSSESSEIFMDQSNIYPLNNSPMLDCTDPRDIKVSTPDFTLKMITLSFHHQPCHLISNHLLHPYWKIQLLTEFRIL